jgi:hypothetical protein
MRLLQELSEDGWSLDFVQIAVFDSDVNTRSHSDVKLCNLVGCKHQNPSLKLVFMYSSMR